MENLNFKTINSIINEADEDFINEITDEINSIIDTELNKPENEVDEQLIDDCVNALLLLSGAENYEAVNESTKSFAEKIIKQISARRRRILAARSVCACLAAITVLGFTIRMPDGSSLIDTAGSKIMKTFRGMSNIDTSSPTGDDDSEESTEATVTEASSETEVTEGETDKTSEAAEPESKVNIIESRKIKQLYGDFPDGFVTEFESADKIKLDGLSVMADYSDKTTEEIKLTDCKVAYSSPDSNYRVRVTVSYSGLSFSFYVRVMPREVKNPVKLTSIYGEFDGGYTVDKMTVYGVYSDGTKKEIPIADCEITSGYDEDFGGNRVVVSFGGCDFGFMTEG